MDGESAARFVDRIVRKFDAGARPLAFEPARNGATTKISHRGFSVEIGVGRCEQGTIDLLVGVALGPVPAHHRDAFLTQLLEWNHCTSGIGHFSLDEDGKVSMVSRHGLEGLDAEGLAGIIGAMVTAARGALEAMALAELSAGVTVE
ncbi:MAG: CesT family type III secretion system chaperone [Actinomycetota bacterium]